MNNLRSRRMVMMCVLMAFAGAPFVARAVGPARAVHPVDAATPHAVRAGSTPGSTRTSGSYSIGAEINDAGGQISTSASYSQNGSAGGVAGISSAGAPATEVAKTGYLGQLYDIAGLKLGAASLSVAENNTLQLAGGQLLDDATTLALPASTIVWSVAGGPLNSVSAGGLAAAGTVYRTVPAVVRGSYQGSVATLALTVVNTNIDDYGEYAGDGIDDSWQVQYFGVPPNANAGPEVDFDGTGQTNLFKYITGLDPLDPSSRFVLKISAVPGRSDQKNINFAPIFGGRTYKVFATPDISGGVWTAINASVPNDNGSERTITDLAVGGGAQKFYQVRISKP